MEKNQVMGALHKFIRQRPQLEFGNYGELKAYRAEVRSIGRDLQDAEALLAAVSWRGITGDDLANAAKHSFSGRLSLVEKGDRVEVDYCTGQYWPTEYRRAACAVLASALWEHWRPADSEQGGDKIRATARRELGSRLARRWFR
jgi:hypothetical protein